MALLSERDRKLIQQRLAEMQEPVKLVHFTQTLNCELCPKTQKLLAEVAALSEKLTLEVYNFQLDREKVGHYGIDKVPATIVEGDQDYGVRIYGLPSGYEFPVLLEAILQVSQRASGLAPETAERLRGLRQPVHLEVLVTPI
jgi:glutaredoxin-like protein